jgi:glycosyltransferase involved in cell wall biosynthesis
MPNVVLEAMAAGRAVVAADVEGVSEALGPGATSQMVPLGQPARFVELLSGFLQDAEARSAVGAANRERAQQAFSFAAVVSAYEALYAELLNKPLAHN